MASLIPDFGYDIFISYRQNDNKYDGWINGVGKYLKALVLTSGGIEMIEVSPEADNKRESLLRFDNFRGIVR